FEVRVVDVFGHPRQMGWKRFGSFFLSSRSRSGGGLFLLRGWIGEEPVLLQAGFLFDAIECALAFVLLPAALFGTRAVDLGGQVLDAKLEVPDQRFAFFKRFA